VDRLAGLKENVIVGRLIPAGTGNVMARLREVAASRDEELEEKARKESEAMAIADSETSEEEVQIA
jgi:DNA-directed RNA polymerase subunit beta'